MVWSCQAWVSNVLEFYVFRNGNSDYSLKILEEIEDLLETLSTNEFIGRLTSNKITRVIPMKVYLIFLWNQCKSNRNIIFLE